MRKYTDKFVAAKLFNRLHSAACPFPGKYPLRLFVKVDGVVKYHGKFHSAVWRAMIRNIRNPVGVTLIYDKAGAVLWGMGPLLRVTNENLAYRYFASTWIQSEHLDDLTLQSIGGYRVYLNDTDTQLPGRPLNRSRFVHYVNTNIASIRTI